MLSQFLVDSIRGRGYDYPVDFWAALSFLAERTGSVPQSDVAEFLVRDKATATRLLERMECRGLIERKTHPRDRRQKCISMTSAGLETFRALSPAAILTNETATSGIHPTELATCIDVLTRVYDNLQAYE